MLVFSSTIALLLVVVLVGGLALTFGVGGIASLPRLLAWHEKRKQLRAEREWQKRIEQRIEEEQIEREVAAFLAEHRKDDK